VGGGLRGRSTNCDRWGRYRADARPGLEEPICVEAGASAYERGYEPASRCWRPAVGRGVLVPNDILARLHGCGAPGGRSDIPRELSSSFDESRMSRWPFHALDHSAPNGGQDDTSVTMELIGKAVRAPRN